MSDAEAGRAPTDTGRVDPVPDHETGAVFPGGRGYETHGVYMDGEPDVVDQWNVDGRIPAQAPPEVPDVNPIPVYVVAVGGDRYLKRARVVRGSAGDVASYVVSRDEHGGRTKVRIRNVSTTAGDIVWLSSEQQQCTPAFGYPLAPGESLDLSTEDAVWITRDPAAPTNPIPVAAVVEYTLAVHE